MFAREFLSSHRATLSASRKDSANSNYSRTYTTPGGWGHTGLQVRPSPQLLCFPYVHKNSGVGGMSKQSSFLPSRLFRPPAKMSARRHFPSLFSQSPLSALFPFNYLRTLSFSVSYLSAVLPTPSALFYQKPGCTPSGHTNASDGSRLSLRNLFSAFRLSVLCFSAVSPSSLSSPLLYPTSQQSLPWTHERQRGWGTEGTPAIFQFAGSGGEKCCKQRLGLVEGERNAKEIGAAG